MARAASKAFGTVVTDAEVTADTRWIDFWLTPDAAGDPLPEWLGLLGRLLAAPVTMEFFHNTPNGDDLVGCVLKHGEFRRMLSRSKALPPTLLQWVISAGRPEEGMAGLRFEPAVAWTAGVYETAPLLWTRLVVVNELPIARDTLLLRLLGAGAVLKRATAELVALPEPAPERELALPILLQLRFEVPVDPAEQTDDDREFLMTTEDVVETFRRNAVEEGRMEGRMEGRKEGRMEGRTQGRIEGSQETAAKLVLRQLRVRFGAQVDRDIERRVMATAVEQLELWADRIVTASTLAEVFAD